MRFKKRPQLPGAGRTKAWHHHGSDKRTSNISTTPLRQWGFRQCLPFSWTTLRGKHCWHPIALMGVVDTFGIAFSEKVFLSKYIVQNK